MPINEEEQDRVQSMLMQYLQREYSAMAKHEGDHESADHADYTNY